MHQRSFIFLVCLFFIPIGFYSIKKSNIEEYIIKGELDSASMYISKTESSAYTQLLTRVINKKASYKDYIEFLNNVNIVGTSQYQRLNSFIASQIIPPFNFNKLDLDYVILKWNQINMLRNDISLEDASKENEVLRKYIKKFENKKDDNYTRATIYLATHDIVLMLIQGKIDEGIELSQENEKKAISIKDTNLILTSKYFLSDFLKAQNKLDEFIENCIVSLKLEKSFSNKSFFYEPTIENLLDASIYKGNFDPIFMEEMLSTLYYSPSKLYSFNLYAKYLTAVPEDTLAQTRVFKIFGVGGSKEFCDTLISQSEENDNSLEQYQLLYACAEYLYVKEYYEEAFELKERCIQLNKKIYSQELAQNIADYQSLEIERKKEAELTNEREKKSLYILLIALVSIFLIIALFLVFKIRNKSKTLEIRNKEKELLLKEIHHRVKNNFQIISSLLELQSKGINDTEALERINEGKSRIKSMSLIHQKLYQTKNVALVSFQEYAEQLTKEILGIYKLDTVVTNINTNKIELDIDTSVPFGLILNELITNSCKYAFSDNQKGVLTMRLEKADEQHYLFTFADNGNGLNKDIDIVKNQGLGLRLVQRLVKQLQGTIVSKYEGGLLLEIKFKTLEARNEID